MDSKKLKARMEMLRKLSKDKSSEMHSGLGEGLRSKKFSKVEIIAKDAKGLKEGLSKAQQILKAKLGNNVDKSEDLSDDKEALCDACNDEGCELCEEEAEELNEE